MAISEICQELKQTVIPSRELADQTILYTGLAHIEAASGVAHQVPTPANSLKSAVKRYEPGDIIFARMRPNLRKVALMDFDEGGYVSLECIVLTVKERDGHPIIDPLLLSVLLRSDLVYGQVMHLIAGIGRPRLAVGDLRRVVIPSASYTAQEKWRARYLSKMSTVEVLREKAKKMLADATMLERKTVEQLAQEFRLEMEEQQIRRFLLAGGESPLATLAFLTDEFIPAIVAKLNESDTRRRMALYGGDRVPENERNLTDVRNRMSLLIEYKLAWIGNDVMEAHGITDLFWANVVANRFPDLELRNNQGLRGVRVEVKCLQTIAEEKSANFDTLKKDLNPNTDYIVVFIWEWFADQSTVGWDRAPRVLRAFVFHASSLAELRDYNWLGTPPNTSVTVFKALTFATLCTVGVALTTRRKVTTENCCGYGAMTLTTVLASTTSCAQPLQYIGTSEISRSGADLKYSRPTCSCSLAPGNRSRS